jgi:predicted amidohydrolase
MGAAALGTLGSQLPLHGAVRENSNKELLPPFPAEGSVRVAVVQQNGNPGKVEENREKALGFASEALRQKANVILFHEEMLVGYVENLHELAEPLNGPTNQAFQKLLQGTETRVIYGLTERDGDFPEMTRSYANFGCSMLFWMNNRRSRGHKEVQRLAYINSMIMPTSCCCGANERGQHCEGGSNITGAKGELIEDIWDKEGIVIQDLYPGEVEAIRKENPLFNGLRPEIYYYG